MTGSDLRSLRYNLGHRIVGRELTPDEMARLCGLPDAGGAEIIRGWERNGGPVGPAAVLATLYLYADRPGIPNDVAKAGVQELQTHYGDHPHHRAFADVVFRRMMEAEIRRRLSGAVK